jgi:hypothetical protein
MTKIKTTLKRIVRFAAMNLLRLNLFPVFAQKDVVKKHTK